MHMDDLNIYNFLRKHYEFFLCILRINCVNTEIDNFLDKESTYNLIDDLK